MLEIKCLGYEICDDSIIKWCIKRYDIPNDYGPEFDRVDTDYLRVVLSRDDRSIISSISVGEWMLPYMLVRRNVTRCMIVDNERFSAILPFEEIDNKEWQQEGF